MSGEGDIPDPASWLVIERGWKVLSSDGSEIGSVDEVVGDTSKDIFNGLAVSTGLLEIRYLAAEQVAEIRDGEVTAVVTTADELPKYEGSPP